MPPQTLIQKLKKANDDYHEVVADILNDEDVPVGLKVSFASIVSRVFSNMNEAHELIKEHYEPQA